MVNLSKIDKSIKAHLVHSSEYVNFYKPFFNDELETKKFLKKSLKKISTRRMMLRVVWYVNIADGMPKIKEARPALQVAFLISMAEHIARRRHTVRQANRLGSQKLVLNFFNFITDSDKKILQNGIRRLLGPHPTPRLRSTSVIRILYDIRNRVFHGQDFWTFSLQNQNSTVRKITFGYLGKIKRKERVTLDIGLKYKEIRDIFIRTAIKNIESVI